MLTFRILTALTTIPFLIACGPTEPAAATAQDEATTRTAPLDSTGDVAAPQATPQDVRTVPYNENGPRYTWSITPAPNGTFGFSIYDRGKLYIRQLEATGLGGPDGWKRKEDARTVALAALEKLEKGEMPEGLTIVEGQ